MFSRKYHILQTHGVATYKTTTNMPEELRRSLPDIEELNVERNNIRTSPTSLLPFYPWANRTKG